MFVRLDEHPPALLCRPRSGYALHTAAVPCMQRFVSYLDSTIQLHRIFLHGNRERRAGLALRQKEQASRHAAASLARLPCACTHARACLTCAFATVGQQGRRAVQH